MTSPSVAAFYADRHLGNRFGVLGPYYDDKGHKGVDFIHAPRTPIPSWCRGRVVVSTFYRALGQTVIIDRDDGEGFAGFCHLTLSSGLKVGAYVQPGDVVGLVGSTGTASSGPHLHATLEPTSVIGTRNALDPLPHILKARAATIKPAAPAPGVPILPDRPNRKADTMILVQRKDGAFECSLFHPSLAGPTPLERGYIVVTDLAVARGLARTWHNGGWGGHKVESRAVYVEEQAAARVAHAAYLRGLPKAAVLEAAAIEAGSLSAADVERIAAAVTAGVGVDLAARLAQ